MTTELVTAAVYVIGCLAGLNLWLLVGMTVLYLSDAETDNLLESILLALVFPMALLNLLIDWLEGKLSTGGEG